MPEPQVGEPTYADKLTRRRVPPRPGTGPRPSSARIVRAGNPRPGAWFRVGGRRVKVWRARTSRDGRRAPVPAGPIDADGALGTADGVLVLDEVQPEGKRAMAGARVARRACAATPTRRSRMSDRPHAPTSSSRRSRSTRSCASRTARSRTSSCRSTLRDSGARTARPRARHRPRLRHRPHAARARLPARRRSRTAGSRSLDPPVRAALRLGAYQLLIGVPAHAAVGETVGVVDQRARGFVERRAPRARRGRVRRSRCPTATTSSRSRCAPRIPTGSCARSSSRSASTTRSPRSSSTTHAPPVTLRVNPLRTTTEAMTAELARGGRRGATGHARARRAAVAPHRRSRRAARDRRRPRDAAGPGEPGDRRGARPAAGRARARPRVRARAARPPPRPSACAASGVVVAADLHPGSGAHGARAPRNASACATTVVTVVADGRHPAVRDGAFDRVLLDAPCSGLGVLRRRPDARWRVQPTDVRDLAALQRVLLAAAADAVKPGGRLVYAVCTLVEGGDARRRRVGARATSPSSSPNRRRRRRGAGSAAARSCCRPTRRPTACSSSASPARASGDVASGA